MTSSARCLSVMYHYIGDRRENAGDGAVGLSPDAFARQIDDLCSVATPIDWPTFLAWRRDRTTIPDPSFLLTFDDGLSDHIHAVAPILETRDVSAVFVVPTACVLNDHLATAHQIHLLLSAMDCEELLSKVDRRLSLEGFIVDDAELTDAESIYSYESPQRARLKFLLHCVLPIDLRNRIIQVLFTDHVGDPTAFAKRWYLSRDEVRALHAAGHTIGGHSHKHEPLGRLTAEDLIEDVTRCAESLNDLLGRGDRPFAYPFGSTNNDVRRCCADAGFVNGFTTRSDWTRASDDAHDLPRVDTIHVGALLERELACMEA